MFTCPSRITAVSLHARGAIITRTIELPADLPAGDVQLRVPGITVCAEPGSFRASATGGSVQMVHTHLELPSTPAAADPQQLRALERKKRWLERKLSILDARRTALATIRPAPVLRASTRVARLREAHAIEGVLTHAIARLDHQRITTRAELDATDEALADARVPAASSVIENAPTFTAQLHLHAVALTKLTLSYAVRCARWWPVYTLRASSHVELSLDALIVQTSGEDWSKVAISLSTADLLTDARLPVLPTLRVGRAQPPRRGWRPPPTGLDRLFSSYDLVRGPLPSPMRPSAPAPIPPPAPPPAPLPASAPAVLPAAAPQPIEALDEDDGAIEEIAAPPRMQAKSRSMFSLGGGGPARGGAPSATMRVPDPEGSTEQYAGSARQAPPEPEPAPIEPANAWMDYESLVLQGPEHPRRGRLTTPPDHTTAHRITAYDRIKAISVPHDPLQTRGQFDHRYHADAPCDVPADGTLHRASVVSGRASFRIVHKTVPRLAPEVYRTIEFSNPLDAPLLSGPVDVWEDGSLLARAELERVDRGGKVRIGMGVEERVRVARNAWMEEEAAGVLRGGGTSLIHTVSMELSSALPGAVEVEVYDRIPVTDNKNILIKLEKTNPEPTTYKQDDRNNPIRGGLLWRVHLEPGRRTTIHYGYRVQIPARTELIGGNRRED